MIDDLKARMRELSDADVEVLADPQRPCKLRDHRVADELVTALAREVRAFRSASGLPRAVYAIDEAARAVTLSFPGWPCGDTFPLSDFTDAANLVTMRRTAAALPGGHCAAWLRAREELIRRGLIAGEGVAGD